jgi:tRNA(fMet)-specific endonuclease VapC
MPYLLDSDILIYYTNGVSSTHALITRLAPDGIAVSVVSYMETQQGISRSPHPHDAQARFDALLDWVPIVPFARAEALQCAQVRETLENQGKRVRQRALDLMIAATALEHGLTLVTNNPADYHDIPGLQLLPAQVSQS